MSAAIRKDRLRRAIDLVVGDKDRRCRRCRRISATVSRAVDGDRHRGLDRADEARASSTSTNGCARERRPVTFPLGLLGAKGWIEYQPKGVVGVIAPWNFPVNLIMAPIANIFAAGNRAMVKSSEFTARTAALFEEICPQYFASGRDRVLLRRAGGRQGVRRTAVRPSDLHRRDRDRPTHPARRGRQPDAGDARTRRQVAGDRGRRAPTSRTPPSASRWAR